MSKTHIAIVLDSSKSMNAIRKEAVDAFNEKVKTIRKSQKKAKKRTSTTVSLVTFSTKVHDPKIWMSKPESIKKLDIKDYKPIGMTAMLDAVGWTIDSLSSLPDADDKNTAYLVIIISDGRENNSKKETYSSIREKISKLKETDRWTFTYLGANQNLSTPIENMGIPAGNTQVWESTSDGTKEASQYASAGIKSYLSQREEGATSSNTFFERESKDNDSKN